MRSAEIARAAGVSVRTLRHYHRLGVLPEPLRHANGYRVYGWEHLARLVRIRSLAGAGVPLARIRTLLSDEMEATSATGELEQIEKDLTARIDALIQQRDLVRTMRGTAHPLSAVPPDLGQHLDRVEVEVPAEWAAFDEDLTLLMHLAAGDANERQQLAELYAEVASPRLAGQMKEVVHAFAQLGKEASPSEVDAVVAAASELSANAASPKASRRLSGLSLQAARLAIDFGPFTTPQRAVLRRLLSA